MPKKQLVNIDVYYPQQYKALSDVLKERDKQIEKWGNQTHATPEWLAIMIEELGEVSKHWLDGRNDGSFDPEKYYTEVVQATAVMLAWLEDEVYTYIDTSEYKDQ